MLKNLLTKLSELLESHYRFVWSDVVLLANQTESLPSDGAIRYELVVGAHLMVDDSKPISSNIQPNLPVHQC